MAEARRSTGRGPARALKPGLQQLLRWLLGHFLTRRVLIRAARHGDVQGALLLAGDGAEVARLSAQVRGAGPLYRGRFTSMTAHVTTVREVLSSNDFRAGFDPAQMAGFAGRSYRWAVASERLGPLEPPSLLVTEPPDHTRYRQLVTRVFSGRAVGALGERIEQIARSLLDELPGHADAAGSVELVRHYCTQLPVTVIAEILGVPPADRERVLAFGAAAAPSLDVGLGWRQFRASEAALAEFDRWLDAHIETLRARPGEDLFSQLLAAQEAGQRLSNRELKATAGLILVAGFETTVNLLGNGVALIDQHPAERRRLQADPALWANAVEEVLRFDPPVLLTSRTALRDTVVAGQAIRSGTMVTTMLAGANRDPAVFVEADHFLVERANAREHVSFSAGRHFCLGAALARIEGEVGLRTLFERFPDLTCRPGARRRPTRVLRGFQELPVRLEPPKLS